MQIQHTCGITDGVTLEGWKAEPGKLQSKLTTLQAELSVTEFKSEALSQYTRWRAKEVWSLHSHTQVCVHTHMNIHEVLCVCMGVCMCTKMESQLTKTYGL
ncbi:hypothetical protein ACRRTK_009391 [Alexandromys fortis]